MFQPKIQKTTLPSGIRLLTIPMPQVRSVAVLVLVGVGSRYEDAKTNGLAHFYEHVVGKGTEKYPNRKTLALLMDKIGAETNAGTDKEYTGYWAKAESRHLEKILDFLSQKICWPLLTPISIEAEKPVIIEEINMREDIPTIKVSDTLVETMFAGHPLGLSGAGEKKAILKFGRDDFLEFKKGFYVGKNMVIVVSGNPQIPQTPQITQLISKYFGSLPKGKRGKFEPFTKSPKPACRQAGSPKSPKVKVINKKTDQVHLALGFRGFSRLDDKNRAPQALLDVILGAGMSSRLFQKVREEKSLAYYVGSSVAPYLDTAIFYIGAGVDKQRTEEALKIVLNELQTSNFAPPAEPCAAAKASGDTRLATHGKLQAGELRKAKDYLRGHWALSLEDPLGYAWWYGLDELLENRTRTLEEVIEITEKVTAEDIARVAHQIFTPQNLSLAVVGEGLKEEKLKEICLANFPARNAFSIADAGGSVCPLNP